mgnify:CR=1 FL=1
MKEGIAYSKLGLCAREGESVITRLMADKLSHPEMLSLAAGFTDNLVLPEDLVLKASVRLGESGHKTHLQYGMNRGHPELRKWIVELLRSYPGEGHLDLNPEQVIVTNGSQQGLYILVQMLCDPGDIVLVESPSYFVFLELLKGLGVRAVSMPCDDSGRIDIEGTEALLESLRDNGELDAVRMVYLMGAFANPSTLCLDEPTKTGLARLLRSLQRPVPVVEDMAYRELYFEQPFPARSILALEEWGDHPVIYAGTFTKPFATGLKIAFRVSRDTECLDTVAKIKGHQDFGSANYTQSIIASLIPTREYKEHLIRVRAHYRDKRNVLEEGLVRHGLREAGWKWEQPQGGLLLWARGPAGTDTRMGSPFHRLCVEKEIMYVPGDLCFAEEKPWNCVRLSFGALERSLIPEAARRFCEAALDAGP